MYERKVGLVVDGARVMTDLTGIRLEPKRTQAGNERCTES